MSETFTLNLLEIPVFYINLDKDIEKRKRLESTLKQIGFKNINRFPGIEEDIKRIGVAKSHQALLNKLSGHKLPALVLEDDILPDNIVSEIEVPVGADAYYLGNSVWGLYGSKGEVKISLEKYNDDTYRIYNMLAAHAIIYFNKNYIDFLRQAIDFNISIKTNQDKARAQTMKYWNVYAATHPMFYQGGAHEKATRFSLPPRKYTGAGGAF